MGPSLYCSSNPFSETPLSELSLELLLLQVVLPALLEQSHARQALKVVAKWWCFGVGRLLGLTEYLLPAEVNIFLFHLEILD